MESKKILIVDDDIDVITVVKAILSKEGHNVISASDKIEGFKMAYKEKPDLAILDVMMTTQSEGFDVARELQADEDVKGTPVVMITGVRKEMNLPFAFEPDGDWLPVKALLEKPVKPEVLLKTLEEHI